MTEKRRKIILIGVLFPFSLLAGYWSLVGLIRHGDARRIQREIAAAVKAAEAGPVGLQGVDELVRKFRAIDPKHASPEVKHALNEYVNAMERSLDAYKKNQDVTALDKECAEKAEMLSAALK